MTPRAYELMPDILLLLKRERTMKKADIACALQPLITKRGYSDRPHATGFALNYLKKEGYLSQPRHGWWAITESGMSASVDEQWGQRVTKKYETGTNAKAGFPDT